MKPRKHNKTECKAVTMAKRADLLANNSTNKIKSFHDKDYAHVCWKNNIAINASGKRDAGNSQKAGLVFRVRWSQRQHANLFRFQSVFPGGGSLPCKIDVGDRRKFWTETLKGNRNLFVSVDRSIFSNSFWKVIPVSIFFWLNTIKGIRKRWQYSLSTQTMGVSSHLWGGYGFLQLLNRVFNK